MESGSHLLHLRSIFRSDGTILAAGLLLATGIFGIDLSLPLGVAGGVPYVVPVLLCIWAKHSSCSYLFAIIASALTVAGYFLSPEGGTHWVVLTNRGLAIFAIWAVALLGAKRVQQLNERKRFEAALTASEEEIRRYAHIVASTTDNMALLDEHYVYLAANEAYLHAFGKTLDEVIGRTAADVFGDEFFNSTIKPRADRCLAGEIVRYQDWFEFSETGWRYLDVTCSPYLGPNAEVLGYAINTTDITEKRRADEELRKSELKYRTIVDSTNEGYWRVNEDMEIVETNDAICRMLGYTREEILGKRPFDFAEEAEAPGYKAMLADSLKTEKRAGARQWEGRFRRKDGTLIDVHNSGTDFIGPDGKPNGRFAFISNITDRKQAEAVIIESEERFRTVFDTIKTGTMVIDTSGVIQIFNPAAEEMFSYEAKEILGMNVSMLMLEPDRGRHNDYIQNYIKTGEAKVIGVGRQVTGLRKGGEEFPMQIEIGKMEIGNETCFVGSVTDLTEFQSLESQLRQSQKLEAVGQLTGGIAHDFNNLLAVVEGNLSLLVQDLKAGAEAASDDPMELLQAALEASRRGADLTQRLLAFSRNQILQPRILSLNNLVTGMENLLRRTLGETIELKVILKDTEWEVMIDPSQLESALLNLALNARDAMSGGGRLTIEKDDIKLGKAFVTTHPGARTGDFVMLAVSDSGCGMPREVRDKAFDPFFTTKGVGKGSGLGLSMVHGFVKQSGGYIEIVSEPGKGTSVKLYLPRSEEKKEAAEKSEAIPHAGGQETILVVEDEKEVRRVTVRMLKRFGYQVFEAGSGKAALNLLANQDPIDLLITDVVLPGGMNGPKIARAAHKIKPGTKVLFMSGYTKNLDVHEDRIDEVGPLLSKPFSQAELALRVREMLDAVN